MKHKPILILLISLISSLGFSQSSFTLQSAMDYAVSNHNAIKMTGLDLEDASSQINEFKAIGLPKLNLGVDYQYNIQIPQVFFADMQFSLGTKNNLGAGLNLNSQLFDAAWLYGLKAARTYKEQKASEIKTAEYQVKANVIRAYLSVIITEENLKTVEKNIENINQSLNETTEIYKSGFAEQLDVDRLELTIQNLNIQKENFSRIIELAENNLKYAMGYPIGEDIELTEDLKSLADQNMVDEIDLNSEPDYNLRPEYQTIEKGEALNDLDLKRLKAGVYPTLNAFASYNQSLQRNGLFDSTEPGFFPSSLIGLSLNLPLFDGNSRKSSIQRTKIRIEKTSLQKEEFERGVKLEINNAKINYLNSKQLLNSSQNSLAISQDIYNKAQIKFREGVGSSIEVNQAERALFDAQANYTNALYQLILAKSALDIAEGKI